MFFQISPVIHKKRTKSVAQAHTTVEDEDSKPEELSLAPFTANPKITFINVPVGVVQTRTLVIKNPNGHEVKLFVKKSIPEDLNFHLSWNEAKVEKNSEVSLEMAWTPGAEEASRHTFTLSDGKRINRDIAVTFKSVAPKRAKSSKGKSQVKARPHPVSLHLVPKSKSPQKKGKLQQNESPKSHKRSPVKQSSSQFKSTWKENVSSQAACVVTSNKLVIKEFSKDGIFDKIQQEFHPWSSENITSAHFHENKENFSPNNMFGNTIVSPGSATFLIENKGSSQHRATYVLTDVDRRDTYVIKSTSKKITETETTYNISSLDNSVFLPQKENSLRFSDSLENSPNRGLHEKNKEVFHTPTLESLLSKQATTKCFRDYFEQKSPQICPLSVKGEISNSSFNYFNPQVCSSTSKPPSASNSRETTPNLLSFSHESGHETFTKHNISSSTYVKDESDTTGKENISPCTSINSKGPSPVFLKPPRSLHMASISSSSYVRDESDATWRENISPCTSRKSKGPSPVFLKPPRNLHMSTISSSTYVKDESDATWRGNISPCTSRNSRGLSPVFLKPRSLQMSTINESGELESGIFSESLIKTGCKRKSATFTSQPVKRERLSSDPKLDWSKTGASAFRLAKTTTGLTKSKDGETISKTLIVQNPFLYASIIDPFMGSAMYVTEDWMNEQEKNFTKWLNALLTPPEELNARNEVDVAKVWQACTRKDVSEAPTKEQVSFHYHTNKKLDNLRKLAQQMFKSPEMTSVYQKVCLTVETGKLSIREDKDIHLNLKLKADIIRLVLGYNPLWLRIGLETIYNEVIPLTSNSDVHGLTDFLFERFLKDPLLLKKHKSLYNPKYSADLKKFMLKRFLILVYFLDRAKNAKLIAHDPCLFCRNATEKESKLVLTHFARETLFAVGDITKYLKCLGYQVTYVQTYIHEFDFAVKSLGSDLRDGVRLAKVMEIIQMRDDLIDKMRVPAISRLQKVHNMQVVFNSLQESGYEIQYEIVPKDVVDGCREKTLSFLWQIIYKFEAPYVTKNVTIIQNWFRSLPVVLKRRKLQKIRRTREEAALKIQTWYRRQQLATLYCSLALDIKKSSEERRQHMAAVKLQNFFKMVVCRKRYLEQHRAVLKLQARAKAWLVRNYHRRRIQAAIIIQKNFRTYMCRKRFLSLKKAVLVVQKTYRAVKLAKQTRHEYHCLKSATVTVQQRFRATLLMRSCRLEFVTLREATIKIQSYFRMYSARKHFLRVRQATVVIQRRYRALTTMRDERTSYISLKKATICVQQRYRAVLTMRRCRLEFVILREASIKIQSYYRMYSAKKHFLRLRQATVVIQRRYRALTTMRIERTSYMSLKKATICVQQRYRAVLTMRRCRLEFVILREASIKIQSYYRMYSAKKHFLRLRQATVVIQRRYRALTSMRIERTSYMSLKTATICVQQRYRAVSTMRRCRLEFVILREASIKIQSYYRMYSAKKHFLRLRQATVVIQRRYRALTTMRDERTSYISLKKATICVQQRYRAVLTMRRCRLEFVILREATIKIQSYYRMHSARKHFLQLRQAAIFIQRRYRALMTMRDERMRYIFLKKATICIQQRYRAVLTTRSCRLEFVTLRQATIKIQRKYRMIRERKLFLKLRQAAMLVQKRVRANQNMKRQRAAYQQLKSCALVIQRRWAARQLRVRERESFLRLKHAVITVQQLFRANKLMKKQRQEFLDRKRSSIKIQTWYRSLLAMRLCRQRYQLLKKSVFVVEERYLALMSMKTCSQRYLKVRKSTIVIQRWYRRCTEARQIRNHYLQLRKVTILIQQRFRARQRMLECRTEYARLRKTVIFVQLRYRSLKTMTICRQEYVSFKSAVVTIQQRFRAQKLMKEQRQYYQELKKVTIKVQQRFRANLLSCKVRAEFIELKTSTLVIQRKFRAHLLMKAERSQFLKLRDASITIQQRYRAKLLMTETRAKYFSFKKAAVAIQRRYRAKMAMQRDKQNFVNLQKAVISVQRRFRANRAGKECRSRYLALRAATLTMQRRLRASKMASRYRLDYCRIRWAAVIIQLRYRATLTMRTEMLKYKKLRSASVVIQRWFRSVILCKQQRTLFVKFKASVVIIQRQYRAYLLMRRASERYLAIRGAVMGLQPHIKGFLARKKYQPLLTPEAVQQRKLLKRQNEAAIKIQACWRGYLVRKSNQLFANPRRHQAHAKGVPIKGKTLAQRCEDAIIFTTAENTSLTAIISALADFDFITKHSKECCNRLSSFLPSQMYCLITSSSRSQPEMRIGTEATRILINFYRNPESRDSSWDPEYLEPLVNVMMHWCDKEEPLFSTIATLMWLFAHVPEWKQVITNVPHIHTKLSKIHMLVQRKQNMVLKCKNVSTSQVFGRSTNAPLPFIKARWGLNYDRPNTFEKAEQATKELLKILDVNVLRTVGKCK